MSLNFGGDNIYRGRLTIQMTGKKRSVGDLIMLWKTCLYQHLKEERAPCDTPLYTDVYIQLRAYGRYGNNMVIFESIFCGY